MQTERIPLLTTERRYSIGFLGLRPTDMRILKRNLRNGEVKAIS
jgi:hypothetical protein